MRRAGDRARPTASTAGRVSWREAAGEVERLRAAYAAGRLRPRPSRRPAAREPAGVLLPLVRAQCARRQRRADQCRDARGRTDIPDRPQRDRRWRSTLPAREGATCAPPRLEAGTTLDTMPARGRGPHPGGALAGAPRAGEPIGRSTECALLYTSGTTGRPKGCRLANEYFLRAGEWYAGLGGSAAVRPDAERIITPLPLNHMNAMAFSTMVVLTAGGCLVQLDRFHPRTLVAERARQPRDHRALPRRDAGDAAGGAARSTPTAQHSVRFGFGAGVDRKTPRARSRSASAFRWSRRGR